MILSLLLLTKLMLISKLSGCFIGTLTLFFQGHTVMFGDVGCFNYRDKTVDYGIFVDDDDGVLTTRAITMYNCRYSLSMVTSIVYKGHTKCMFATWYLV